LAQEAARRITDDNAMSAPEYIGLDADRTQCSVRLS
jgi:hypothetical protein